MSNGNYAGQALTRVRAKVEQGKKHLHQLEAEVRSFLDSNPFEVASRRDPQSHELIYYVARVKEVPYAIAATAADVLLNLRRALDHLACEFVVAAGNYPTRNTGFPVSASAGIYKAQLAEKIEGMHRDAVKPIEASKPYKGGNDALWCLHALGNVDKQRLLTLTGVVYRFDEMTPTALENIRRLWQAQPYSSEPFPDSPPAQAFIQWSRRPWPVKEGEVLFVDLADAKVDRQKGFRFDVALGEGKIANGVILVAALKEMLSAVEMVLSDCRSLFE